MSIGFEGLGGLLVYALFFYLVIYFAVKHAIVIAHKQMEEDKKNFEVEVKRAREQESNSKMGEERVKRENSSARGNAIDKSDGFKEDNNIDEYNSF